MIKKLIVLFLCVAAFCQIVSARNHHTQAPKQHEEKGSKATGQQCPVVAIGDLHGDLFQAQEVLKATGLMDPIRMQWTGGNTTLIQTGDMLDGGPDDIAVVQLLIDLGEGAKQAGGRVITLLGNHEVMNLHGNFSQVHPQALESNGGRKGREKLLSEFSPIGKHLRNSPVFYDLDRGNGGGYVLFVHGGVSMETWEHVPRTAEGREKFNSAITRILTKKDGDGGGERGVEEQAKRVLQLRAEDAGWNPLILRELADCFQSEQALFAARITLLVSGHTPHSPDLMRWSYCDGHVGAIDFGLSRWKGGHEGDVGALEFDPFRPPRLVKAYGPVHTSYVTIKRFAARYRMLMHLLVAAVLCLLLVLCCYCKCCAGRGDTRGEGGLLLPPDPDKEAPSYGTVTTEKR